MLGYSPNDLDATYWKGLDEGRLRLPRCGGCGRWQWPAVARCGPCGHWGSDWQDLPMTGTIFTWTRTWHPFGGLEGLPLPFVTVVVEIGDTGRRLMGLLETGEDGAPVAIGQAVAGHVTRTTYGEEQVPVITWRAVDRTGADQAGADR